MGLFFKNHLSGVSEEAERAIKAKALSVGVKAVANTRKFCKILVLLVFSASLFAFSAFSLLEELIVLFETNSALSPSLAFYSVTVLLSLGLIAFVMSEKYWIQTLEIDDMIQSTIKKRP